MEQKEDQLQLSQQKKMEEVSHFRYYPNLFPVVDEIVMTRVEQCTDFGVEVFLQEYQLNGFLPLSEIKLKPRQNLAATFKKGKTEPMRVIRVDSIKGYVDLSRSQLNASDKEECVKRFTNAKATSTIINQLAVILHQTHEYLYENIVWALEGDKWDSCYDAFKATVDDPSVIKDLQIEEKERATLLTVIKKKLTVSNVKLEALFEATCFHIEGVEALQKCFEAGKKVETPEMPLKITVKAAPLYSVALTTKHEEEGRELLETALATMKKELEQRKGFLVVKQLPLIVCQ